MTPLTVRTALDSARHHAGARAPEPNRGRLTDARRSGACRNDTVGCAQRAYRLDEHEVGV